MSRRIFALVLGLGVAGAWLVASPARAAFAPPSIISAKPGAQGAGDSLQIAVAAGGRYAVFRSAAGNLYPPGGGIPGFTPSNGGLFRKDLTTGELDLVVPANLRAAGSTSNVAGTLGTQEPSISADGRYVVFTTSVALVPNDANSASDVYRRDLAVPLGSPGAFTLVSAIDGGDAALTYRAVAPQAPGSRAYRRAMSDDGNRVVFFVTAQSNLGNEPPTNPATTAPFGQVAVRDIAARRTILLSTTLESPHRPAPLASANILPATVQISGDGSAVAWDTSNPGLQVRLGDTTTSPLKRQLLWKRVDDGAAPTARLASGASDPDDPACPPGGQPTDGLEPGPCDGPFQGFRDRGEVPMPVASVASMSRDGSTLLILGNTLRDPVLLSEGLGGRDDLFLLDMTPGLTRKGAVTRLTAGADARSAANVTSAAMSPDGQWIAFTAASWVPTLRSPAPIGGFVPPLNTGDGSLYVIDRGSGTIEQLSAGFDGTGSNGRSTGASISEDGLVVGAESNATNLFYGDSNNAFDGVAYHRLLPKAPAPAVVEVPPATVLAPLAEQRALRVAARSLPTGAVRLTITTPAAGTLTAAAVPAPTLRRGGKRARPGKRVTRRATATAADASTTTLDLTLLRAAAPKARRRGGLPAIVTLTFTPAGGAPQVRTFSARFAVSPQRSQKAGR